MRAALKTANLAIVFTDIKGFTERTSQQTLEENEQLLSMHAQLLEPLFGAFGGRIVKSIGDAYLATFESPTQAVLCGIAIQDRLWFHNREAPEGERFDVRVAINVGEVRLESKDVFGEPVNIAARVEGIAEAGEVYFTEAVYLSMNKAEVPSQEVGSFELKGIPGEIKVFRVPRAPYRVEAPQPEPGPEMPPFGNLGLSRVKEQPPVRRISRADELRAIAGAQLTDLGSKAAELGTRAAAVGGELLERTGSALGAPGRRPRWLNAAVVAIPVVVVLGLGLRFALAAGPDAAIRAVQSASAAERPAKIRAAEAVIAAERNGAQAAYYRGRLQEVTDQTRQALHTYGSAGKAGSEDAKSRLIELLGHDECRVRDGAARTLGELKVRRAKAKLTRLAESGGPDDAAGLLGALGCDSRRAARDALRALE
jgi:adenylate cyclase